TKLLFAILFSGIILVHIIGCSSSDSPQALEAALLDNPLIGRWELQDKTPDQSLTASECLPITEFSNETRWSSYSLDNIQKGTYHSSAETEKDVRIEFTVTQDNGLSDCFGISQDLTGLESTLHFEFLGTNEIKVYRIINDSEYLWMGVLERK
ncbi:MAG: hypothetical protein KAG66_05525, partial [Methylococcales bacterium]|nr:hypothetical protein [Methylococcales bacterium]